MLGDAREHLAQIGLGIQAVEFRRADQAVDRRGTLAAGVRPGEEVVLATKCDGAQRALGGGVVDLDVAVVAVADERRPARERVADRDRDASADFADTCARVASNQACDGPVLAIGRGPYRMELT